MIKLIYKLLSDLQLLPNQATICNRYIVALRVPIKGADAGCWPRVTGCALRDSGCELRVTRCGVRVEYRTNPEIKNRVHLLVLRSSQGQGAPPICLLLSSI